MIKISLAKKQINIFLAIYALVNELWLCRINRLGPKNTGIFYFLYQFFKKFCIKYFFRKKKYFIEVKQINTFLYSFYLEFYADSESATFSRLT